MLAHALNQKPFTRFMVLWMHIFVMCSVLMFFSAASLHAQVFNSGSTGADGALDFTGTPAGTIIDFDPTTFNPPLDPEGDSIYHFTTITLPADVTLNLRADKAGSAPLHWLATGAVIIDGTLDLSGDQGHGPSAAIQRIPAIPGPGGFAGGIGGKIPNLSAQAGFGPGAGCPSSPTNAFGGSGGHVSTADQINCVGGLSYGNGFLLPLIGGSGGAGGGGTLNNAAGGGAGGGAILISSSVSITVTGNVTANGGARGASPAGSGSGGAIRLVAPIIDGNGVLSAASGGLGGTGGGGTSASIGRVLVETLQNTFTGQTTGDVRAVTLPPNPILLPAASLPKVRVTSVGGVPTPANPLGRFDMVDVTLNSLQPLQIDLAGENIPLGTTIDVTVLNETEGSQASVSSPLAGTLENSTASITMTIPAGFSRIFTHAKWTP